MSKLSKKRSGKSAVGPVTSTQNDVANCDEEYMDREERVFQRQLQHAIEISKKSAVATLLNEPSSSDGSSQETKKSTPLRELGDIGTPEESSKGTIEILIHDSFLLHNA